jgi:hypothetical protein
MKKKILIIRSVSFQQLDRVINKIQNEFKDFDIEILAHAFNLPRLLKYKQVKRVITYEETCDFSARMIPAKLHKKNYHTIIVPFSNSSGAGFLNVIELALKLKSKQIFSCNLHLEISRLNRTLLFLKKIFSAVNSVFSVLFSLIIFILISPFLLIKIFISHGN